MTVPSQTLFHGMGIAFTPETATGWGCLLLTIILILAMIFIAEATDSSAIRFFAGALAAAIFIMSWKFAKKHS